MVSHLVKIWFISECEHVSTSLVVPEGLHCTIPEHCTGISCCLNIPLINKTINVGIDLDACNYNFHVQVGNFEINESLLSYKFGQWNRVDLNGVFGIRYIFNIYLNFMST